MRTFPWLDGYNEMPAVVGDLSHWQVIDGVVAAKAHVKFSLPVASAGVQYAKKSALGGVRLYLTEDNGRLFLCFPFTNLHTRFVYGGDTGYHTRMNAYRVLRGEPHPEFVSPSQVLEIILGGNPLFNFSMEVFDTRTGGKRVYSADDFLADLIRGPAANLFDPDVNHTPNYMRPFRTAIGVDAFALVAPPGSSSENFIYVLNRPWPIWMNPTNFTGVTLFMPACGSEALGTPSYRLGGVEGLKSSAFYAATRDHLVDTKAEMVRIILESGVYEHQSGSQLPEAQSFHDILVPFVNGDRADYAETISSNVFVVINENGKKILQTPPADVGNYPGVTRFFVLKFAQEVLLPLGLIDEVREAPLTRELLLSNNVLEMFRTGSASGINFVNGYIYFDPPKGKFYKKSLGPEAGNLTAIISEAFELAARGYKLGFLNEENYRKADLSVLDRFSSMCVRLEVPGSKHSSTIPTFVPGSVKDFPQEVALEGVGNVTRMFEKRGALARSHSVQDLKDVARSRYHYANGFKC